MSFLNRWTRDQQRQACISSLIFISWQGAGVCWYHLSLKNNICSTWEYIFYPSPSPPLLMSPEAGHLPAMLLFIALSICTIFLIKMGKKKSAWHLSLLSWRKKGLLQLLGKPAHVPWVGQRGQLPCGDSATPTGRQYRHADPGSLVTWLISIPWRVMCFSSWVSAQLGWNGEIPLLQEGCPWGMAQGAQPHAGLGRVTSNYIAYF